MLHMVPAIAGYIKIGCWEIQLKFETFSFTFEIIVLKSPVRILVENNLNILREQAEPFLLSLNKSRINALLGNYKVVLSD